MAGTRATVRATAPRRIQPEQDQGAVLPDNYKCTLVHHFAHYPDRWEHTDTHGFLPSLCTLYAVPGVNGATRANVHATTGPVNMASVIAGHVGAGASYIDPNDNRLGEFVGYDRNYYPTGSGQRHHVMGYEEATILPTGRVTWNEDENITRFRDFRAQLRDAGIVQPLERASVDLMIDRLTERRNRIADRAKGDSDSTYYTAKLAALDAKVAAIEATWQRDHAAQPDARPTKLGPKKAKASTIETGA